MREVKPSLFKIFCKTFVISACTFGGGFVIASLMKKDFVDKEGWLSEDEVMDYIAIAQSCPGSIAVNAAIMVGFGLRGFIGMAIATLGTILPPMLILSLISIFYEAFASSAVVALMLRGMQAGVAAIILDVVISLAAKVIKSKELMGIVIMLAAFVTSVILKVNVTLIIVAVLFIGVVKAVFEARKGRAR